MKSWSSITASRGWPNLLAMHLRMDETNKYSIKIQQSRMQKLSNAPLQNDTVEPSGGEQTRIRYPR